jgi:hypothetical protein
MVSPGIEGALALNAVAIYDWHVSRVSLVPHRRLRTDSLGTARRQIARRQNGQGEEQHDRRERQGIAPTQRTYYFTA